MNFPDPTPTFWIEPSDYLAAGLRRYHSAPATGWDCAAGYHRALVYLERVRVPFTRTHRPFGDQRQTPHDDPCWPPTCAHCDYRFTAEDAWQDWTERIYFVTTGAAASSTPVPNFVLHPSAGAPSLGAPSAPPGASWDAWWLPEPWQGPDGIALTVRLPNGHDWNVDSEASNCTRKGDRSHRCWVRTGDPRRADVTAGKGTDPTMTCSAGAGSIAAGEGTGHYHGFLVSGVLSGG